MMLQQISQRGRECLKTAELLLRAAQTLTDGVIASQIRALADDYQKRAEKVSQAGAGRAFARSSDSEGEPT